MKSIDIFKMFEEDNIKCISVGELDNSKIAFLKDKCPELINKIDGRTITMWKDRIDHIEKHTLPTENFTIEKMCQLIPEIIDKPDYLGVRQKDLSVQFIKQYDDNILIAVRMDNNGRLKFRTIYTITDSQLKDYISKKRAWRYNIDK